MNFGNFLFGASGGGMGFTLHELLMGAHKNSRFPEDANGNRIPSNQPNPNGYEPRWDSDDDQLSITKGWTHSFLNNYSKKEFKVKVGN